MHRAPQTLRAMLTHSISISSIGFLFHDKLPPALPSNQTMTYNCRAVAVSLGACGGDVWKGLTRRKPATSSTKALGQLPPGRRRPGFQCGL